MVGRSPPPPPPPRRWRLLILAIAVAAILAAAAVVFHPWRAASPPANTINAAIAPGAQPTSCRTTVSLGTDIATGAPLTMELLAANPAELQARVDETVAFIAARRAEGCVAVKLTSGGYAWLPADVAARQAVMMESGKALAEATNRAFEADRLRRQAEIEAGVRVQGEVVVEPTGSPEQISPSPAELAADTERERRITALLAEQDALLSELPEGQRPAALFAARDGWPNANGQHLSVADVARLRGWPQIIRIHAILAELDRLQARPGAPAPRPDDHDGSGPNGQDVTSTGPGEALPNGDVSLGRRRTPAGRQTPTHRPPVIPDPVGLGERLALIDVLVDHFQIPRRGLVLDNVTFDDLVEVYWKAVQTSGKPAPYPEQGAAAQDATPVTAIAVFQDDTPVSPPAPLTAEQIAAQDAERRGPAPGEVVISGRGTQGRPVIIRPSPGAERVEPAPTTPPVLTSNVPEQSAPPAQASPVPAEPTPPAPRPVAAPVAPPASAALPAPVNLPPDLLGAYQVRAATIRGTATSLRSPRELVVITDDRLALHWDGVAVDGLITACKVSEGAHAAAIVALTVKGDTTTYRVHFTFAGGYASEVKIVVEDIIKPRVIGTWTEGRKK